MKNAAIITLTGYSNYGNRLQNYALQQVLLDLGYQATTLRTSGVVSQIKPNRADKGLSYLKGSPRENINRVMNKIHKTSQIKNEGFKNFSREFICESENILSESNIAEDLATQYDYFIIGSDQIWNPYDRHESSIDFAAFAPPQEDSVRAKF